MMEQGGFPFVQTRQEISDDVILRCRSLKAALKMCIEVSGLAVKEVAFSLGVDEKHLTRMLSDNPNDVRHFPEDLINRLMDVCGNEIPLRYLALSRGYGLHKLKSRLEMEVEELQRKLQEKDLQFATITAFLKDVKGGL